MSGMNTNVDQSKNYGADDIQVLEGLVVEVNLGVVAGGHPLVVSLLEALVEGLDQGLIWVHVRLGEDFFDCNQRLGDREAVGSFFGDFYQKMSDTS